MEIQIQITTPDKPTALSLSKLLVQHRLAACTQVTGPIVSTYWWEGQIEQSEEWLCLIKTTREHYAAAEQLILEHHPYEVPQIVALEIKEALPAYRQWIRESVSGFFP